HHRAVDGGVRRNRLRARRDLRRRAAVGAAGVVPVHRRLQAAGLRRRALPDDALLARRRGRHRALAAAASQRRPSTRSKLMSQTPDSALLRVSGVTVQFGGLKAVDDVSFEVYPGELLGLIGPNGAGKTTLMRAITGVVTANTGSIHLGDQELTHLPIHQRIRKGLAFSQQLVKPFRQISVLDNVALAAGATHTRSPLKSLLHTD